jgi:hypothetical protein
VPPNRKARPLEVIAPRPDPPHVRAEGAEASARLGGHGGNALRGYALVGAPKTEPPASSSPGRRERPTGSGRRGPLLSITGATSVRRPAADRPPPLRLVKRADRSRSGGRGHRADRGSGAAPASGADRAPDGVRIQPPRSTSSSAGLPPRSRSSRRREDPNPRRIRPRGRGPHAQREVAEKPLFTSSRRPCRSGKTVLRVGGRSITRALRRGAEPPRAAPSRRRRSEIVHAASRGR